MLSKKVDKAKYTCLNCGNEFDDWTGKKPCPYCGAKQKKLNEAEKVDAE